MITEAKTKKQEAKEAAIQDYQRALRGVAKADQAAGKGKKIHPYHRAKIAKALKAAHRSGKRLDKVTT